MFVRPGANAIPCCGFRYPPVNGHRDNAATSWDASLSPLAGQSRAHFEETGAAFMGRRDIQRDLTFGMHRRLLDRAREWPCMRKARLHHCQLWARKEGGCTHLTLAAVMLSIIKVTLANLAASQKRPRKAGTLATPDASALKMPV